MEKEYDINGRKLTLKSITVREGASDVFDLSVPEKKASAMLSLIHKTLEKSGLPSDVDSYDLSDFGDLASAVVDVNGLGKN